MLQNIFTYCIKMSIYVIIGIPQNRQTKFVQICIAFTIRFLTGKLIVLRAIKFDNDLCTCTIKICNIFAKHFLSIECQRQ